MSHYSGKPTNNTKVNGIYGTVENAFVTLKEILDVVNQLKSKGLGSFQRSGDSMEIVIYDNKDVWGIARTIDSALKNIGGRWEPDMANRSLHKIIPDAYSEKRQEK